MIHKRLLRGFLLLIVLLSGSYFAAAWYFSGMILTPRRQLPDPRHPLISQTLGTPSEDKLPAPQDFSVQTAEGLRLKGWHFQQPVPADCGVVLIHGWGNTRSGMLKYADIFWDCGCDLIAYDHRAHSESEGDYATGGVREKDDLKRVSTWFQQASQLNRNQIAWVGASWGAATALMAGAEDPEIAFILADSPFEDWETAIFERADRLYGTWTSYLKPGVMGLVDLRAEIDYEAASPLRAAANIAVPVLLIHSQTDEATHSSQSVHISAALSADRHVFHHTDWGAGHTRDVDERPAQFRAEVYDFIGRFAPTFATCKSETPAPTN